MTLRAALLRTTSRLAYHATMSHDDWDRLAFMSQQIGIAASYPEMPREMWDRMTGK